MSFKIGTVIGVEIHLHYTWLIIFFLVTSTLSQGFMPQQYPGETNLTYWITGGAASLLLFGSVLFHELFHSYMAIRKGIPVPRITLFLFGGVSQIAEEPSDPNSEFKISVVGPLSSFLLSGIFGIFFSISEFLKFPIIVLAPLSYGLIINILLGFFNLLPAFPLDGGRILRARIWSRKKDIVKATAISTRISSIFAYGFILLGFLLTISGEFIGGLWIILIGWFLKNGSEATLQQTTLTHTLNNVKVSEIMSTNVIVIDSNISVLSAVREYFYKYKHGGYPIISDEKLIGIITTHDIQKLPKDKWGSTYIWDIMSQKEKLVTVSPEESAIDAFTKITKNNFGRLPVIIEDNIVGIVTRSDIMRAMKRRTDLKVEP